MGETHASKISSKLLLYLGKIMGIREYHHNLRFRCLEKIPFVVFSTFFAIQIVPQINWIMQLIREKEIFTIFKITRTSFTWIVCIGKVCAKIDDFFLI